jgi:3-hydroxy-9,10-secoandrosta-1,3,5(10)-triene-9,17-dione monooxygenase reductase component
VTAPAEDPSGAVSTSPPVPPVATFRRACALFATGVVVVTVREGSEDLGVTVNSFTSLSLEPMQVIVCVAHSSKTGTALLRTGVFAVNVLSTGQAELARRFATKLSEKTAGVPLRRGILGPALLHGSHATLECRLADAFARESHTICIGRVVSVQLDESRAPLLFYRGTMHLGVGDRVDG